MGGTGYLGRALVQELLQYNPKKIVIFSRDEVKHFNLIRLFGNNPKIQSVLGDIRDYSALLSAMSGMDIVFHVAALKRMDCLELNVQEAIKTNIIGSLNVFNGAIVNNVKKVLFVSTDKACLPINAYGACKFVSEKLFTNYDIEKTDTKFIVVRFGNILESTGSVIPIFADKIKLGEDIPLTSDLMTRFIIHKVGAVELMFDALRYGLGGEIFVKELPAMKIVDLIDVLKMQLGGENKIRVIGLRPGEKIHEQLISESEMSRAISFNGLFIITPSIMSSPKKMRDKMPIYMQRVERSDNGHFNAYSSDLAIISRDELAGVISKVGIL